MTISAYEPQPAALAPIRSRVPAAAIMVGLAAFFAAGYGLAYLTFSRGRAEQIDQAAAIRYAVAAELKSSAQGAVAQVLKDKPDMVRDALRAADANDQQAYIAAVTSRIPAHRDELLDDPASPIGGNAAGTVTIVEFSDYRCPWCKASAPSLAAVLKADPALQVVYKEFPLLGSASEYAAHAALAAARQGADYGALRAALYAAPAGADGHGTRGGFDSAITGLGLDPTALQTSGSDPAIDQEIDRVKRLAKAMDIRGTPSWIIGDRFYSGNMTIAQLTDAVAAARAAKSSVAP